MSGLEELPEWLTFEGLPDDIEWPPLRTSSGGRVGVDYLAAALGVPAELLDLELTHIQLADGTWIPKPQGCE